MGSERCLIGNCVHEFVKYVKKKQALQPFEGEASCHMFIVLGAEVKDLLPNQMTHPAVTLVPLERISAVWLIS